jgi:hypothetical protein
MSKTSATRFCTILHTSLTAMFTYYIPSKVPLHVYRPVVRAYSPEIMILHVGFEVLTAVVMKSSIFWDITRVVP